MTIASLGLRTTGLTPQTAVWEIIAGSLRVKILELELFNSSSQETAMSFGRPQAAGITPVPVLFQQFDPEDPACQVAAALSWATSPTQPTGFSRRWYTSATAGNGGVIWTFPRGFVLPASGTAVMWTSHATGGSLVDVNCIVDE